MDTTNIAVTVNARPTADFSSDTACLGTMTNFTDLSSTTTGVLSTWLWDFGDGQTGTGAAPTHLYANAGTYSVILTVITSDGCTNDTTHQVEVYPEVTAAFSYNSPACASDSVNFEDLSSSPHGSITTWVWDFGDGNTVTMRFPCQPECISYVCGWGHLYSDTNNHNN